MMKTPPNAYSSLRYPTDIISHTVWLYHRFTLIFRDIEDLLAERGIVVTYETIRQYYRILRNRSFNTWQEATFAC